MCIMIVRFIVDRYRGGGGGDRRRQYIILASDRYANRGKETDVEYKETYADMYVVKQETYETNINS